MMILDKVETNPLSSVNAIFEARRQAKVHIVEKGNKFFHLVQNNKVVGFATSYLRAESKANKIMRGIVNG